MNSIRLLCYYFRQSVAGIAFRSPFVLPSVCSRTAKLKKVDFREILGTILCGPEKILPNFERFGLWVRISALYGGHTRFVPYRLLSESEQNSRVHSGLRVPAGWETVHDGLKLGYSRFTVAGRWRRVTLLSSNDGRA